MRLKLIFFIFHRCRDHQPSDGLGAHKLVLAAASPDFLKLILPGISENVQLGSEYWTSTLFEWYKCVL